MQKNLKNYTILSKIASGGMSEVYLAQDKNSLTKVALKILDSKLSIDPEYVHRFKKEASISSQLFHKNIVKILDYGTFEDSYYIAYEYIEGITLDKYIKQKSLTVPEIENIAIQILEGLSYAHSKNIVHRDIKPSNIMIEDGTVKILDFGIAKQELASTVTKTGLFMGSPHYVSPEQIEGRGIDYRSDIYSFGVVLYEIIEGKVPFSSDTPWGIIRAHLDKKIPEITQDAPYYLKEIVRKCLLKGKEYRPKSAQEIIELIKNRGTPTDKTIIIGRDIILSEESQEKKTKILNEESMDKKNLDNKKRYISNYDNSQLIIKKQELIYSNSIPLWKIFVFSIITSGIYNYYWHYRNWRYIRVLEGTDIKPGLRTIGLFVPILGWILILQQYKFILKYVNNTTRHSFSPGGLLLIHIIISIISKIMIVSSTSNSKSGILALCFFIIQIYLIPIAIVQYNFNLFWAVAQPDLPIRNKPTIGEIIFIVLISLYSFIMPILMILIFSLLSSINNL